MRHLLQHLPAPVKRFSHCWRFAWRDFRSPPPDKGDPASAETLVLVYRSLFGMPIAEPADTLPPGCAITYQRFRYRRADAVLFHLPTLWRLPLYKPKGQIWIAFSLESDEHFPLMNDPAMLRRIDLTMTYRLNSDIPATYMDFIRLPGIEPLLEPPPPKTPGNLAMAMISSSFHNSGRDRYLSELMRHADVHSYGAVLNNRAIPQPDLGAPTKLSLLRSYKFALAFENSIRPDYVTEKFFQPLLAGCVPVYLGAPNIEAFCPGDHCCIKVSDFPSPADLAAYLKHLDNNPEEYQKFFAWKQKPLRPHFLRLFESSRTPAEVRLFEKVRQVRQMRGL